MKKHLRLNRVDVALILLSCIQVLTSTPLAAQSTQKIASGYSHSIAIKSNGSLWVWGSNNQGQLGIGSVSGSFWYPIQVTALANVLDAAGGFEHSVAVKINGTVWSWGNNGDGQLGDGTITQRTAPIQVNGLNNVVNVSAGYYHSLAIKSDGTIWSWGRNDKGQLGTGYLFGSITPVQVSNLSGVMDVSAGDDYSVGLKNDSTVWAWGNDAQGQLGNGDPLLNQTTPIQVSNLAGVIAIAAGRNHILALKADGKIWAWGRNSEGQIGNGNTITPVKSPVQVSNLTNVIAIAAGENHSLAIKVDGTIWAWGSDSQGQIGNGVPLINENLPVKIGVLNNWTSVSAGTHSFSVNSDGIVWGWGNNSSGQLGNSIGGANIYSSSPVSSLFTFAPKVNPPAFSIEGGSYVSLQKVKITCSTLEAAIHYTTNGVDPTENDPVIQSGSKVTMGSGTKWLKARAFKSGLAPSDVKAGVYQIGEKITSGHTHSLAIKSDSLLSAWGNNNNGQLGNGSAGGSNWYPNVINGLTGVIDVAGGNLHSVALKSDGTVWTWGYNGNGELGDGTTTQKSIPVKVIGLSNVVNVAAGYDHSLSIKSDGTVWAWGRNDHGQLGNGTTFNSLTAIQVSGLSGIIDIAGGLGYSVALKNDGTVWAWGYNYYGQLGDGTTIQRTIPVQVSGGIIGIVAIADGAYHTTALKSDGTVWAWGYGYQGQLGNGTNTIFQITPVQVSNLTSIVAIAAGEYHSLALKGDGTLWAWGSDTQGQLGDGEPLSNKNMPVQVGSLTTWISVCAGTHSLAAKSDKSVWGWGNNGNGQLGNGSNSNSSSPVVSLLSFASRVAKPTFSPEGGAYLTSQIVTITCSTSGAVIHYTTNGADPTESDPIISSGATITINSGNSWLKAQAYKAGLISSDVKAAIYQVGGKIASGYAHSIAVMTDGSLWEWGNNSQGQIGNGSTGNNISYPVKVSGVSNVKDAAGGYEHSVVVKSNGTVWAWGRNDYGQLGNGTLNQQAGPVQVSGLNGVSIVGAGYYHSLAIKSDGTVWAWGNNEYGQLGNGTTFNSSTPVQVSGLDGVIDVAGGDGYSVALKSNGTVWAWGKNYNGQLGNGNTTNQGIPVQVTGAINNIVAIAVGAYHTIALKADGTVWPWGLNNEGQAGQTIDLTGVIAIAAGEGHSLTMKSDGTIWAFGHDAEGQLGNGNPPLALSIPIQVSSLTTVLTAAAGTHSLAVKLDGSVWGWGNNTSGQIGNGQNAGSTLPVLSLFTFASKVNQPTFSTDGGAYLTSQKVKIICSTPQATIHYTTDGEDPAENDPVIASGSKVTIGQGITCLKARAFKSGSGLSPSDTKAAVYQIGEKIICSYSHSIAIKSDSMIWVWGSNSKGQLANINTGVNILTPVKLSGITGVMDIAGGSEHSVVLKKDGIVWAWGRNTEGQLGDGTIIQRTSPVQVAGLSGTINIAAGYYHTLAIKSDGTVRAWGKNSQGQLGNGNTFNSLTAVQVSELTSVIDIAAGEEHSVALKSDGTIWTWGRNSEGQLGDGTTTPRTIPVRVNVGANMLAIASGRYHTLALKSDGTVWSWGYNGNGQLGNGETYYNKVNPVQVLNLNDVVAIAAGEYHSLAVKRDGTVWGWGYNGQGQLGDDTTIDRTIPVQVVELAGINSIAAGTHSMAITPIEEAHLYWAWGNNTNGQLGDSSTTSRDFRVLVHFPLDENGNSVPDWNDYEMLNESLSSNDDQDGLIDWEEILIYGTDPQNFDCNEDGIADGVNVFVGLSPLSGDTDGDGIPNSQEAISGTNPIHNDTDIDGVLDGADAFPLDPNLTSLPPPNLSDYTAPTNLLLEPPDAIIIPQ